MPTEVAGVLVTRPAGQEAALCQAVAAAGFRVHSQPLLELQALPELTPPQRSLLLELDLYQHIIFISGNAVRFGMARVEDFWPQLPVGVNWYAIGEVTANLLQDYGVTALTPGADMTSEALLALPQLQAVQDQRVLIIKGEGGRATLRKALAGRGAIVDELACYRRRRPDLPRGQLAEKLDQWGIDVVLISSGEGLDNLQALLRPQETTNFRGISLIVPSQRVALKARDLGFERVAIADNASDVAMLRALNIMLESTE